jgi:hypothetical protein
LLIPRSYSEERLETDAALVVGEDAEFDRSDVDVAAFYHPVI